MSLIDDVGSTPNSRHQGDLARLSGIRARCAEDPSVAGQEVWAWLRELRTSRARRRLAWLFSQGRPSASPRGDGQGMVLFLEGKPWLVGLDGLVRLGQALGGIGWTGKSFDSDAGTGYNRLTSSAGLAARVALPTYRFRPIGGELIGFPFRHAIERSPVAPFHEVRAIRYDATEDHNPRVLTRTRDEIVELVPDVHLGRALLEDGGAFRVVAYFGLRFPCDTRMS